jgi:hypothetical protein
MVNLGNFGSKRLTGVDRPTDGSICGQSMLQVTKEGGAAATIRQDGGGAETRRAARNERKQKTAVLQGVARPSGRQAQPCPRDSEVEKWGQEMMSRIELP